MTPRVLARGFASSCGRRACRVDRLRRRRFVRLDSPVPCRGWRCCPLVRTTDQTNTLQRVFVLRPRTPRHAVVRSGDRSLCRVARVRPALLVRFYLYFPVPCESNASTVSHTPAERISQDWQGLGGGLFASLFPPWMRPAAASSIRPRSPKRCGHDGRVSLIALWRRRSCGCGGVPPRRALASARLDAEGTTGLYFLMAAAGRKTRRPCAHTPGLARGNPVPPSKPLTTIPATPRTSGLALLFAQLTQER